MHNYIMLKSINYETHLYKLLNKEKSSNRLIWVELLGAAAGRVYLECTFLEQFIVIYFPGACSIYEIIHM